MPELPDLQVFSSNLNKALKGKKVRDLNVPVPANLNVSPAKLRKELLGQSVREVVRSGKELHLLFSKGSVLALHMMLRGSLHISSTKDDRKHTIIKLVFDDDTALVLTDWQGRAVPTLNPEPKEAPDALSGEADLAFFKRALQRRSTIKNLLLDQKIIRGIGNAYADEILWLAGISPFSISSKISDQATEQLAKAVRSVLRNAEEQIRKSHPDIISGEVRDFLDIHNAERRTSPTGVAIQHKTVGGRKTYFTEEQELFKQ